MVMDKDFETFEEAAERYAYSRDMGEDCNPVPVMVMGSRYQVCGPTTGTWLSANGLEEAAVVWTHIGHVTFGAPAEEEEDIVLDPDHLDLTVSEPEGSILGFPHVEE